MSDLSDNNGSGMNISLPYNNGPDINSGKNGIGFRDPFLDLASMAMPRSLRNILDLCEGLWLKNGTYRMAASRIVRYFITKVDYDGVDENQRAKLSNFLNNKFKVVENLSLIGDDYVAYGNSFSSIALPFRRYLICSTCKSEQPILNARWKFTEFKFQAYCNKCRTWKGHTHLDRRSAEEDKISVKRWAPQQLRLLAHPYFVNEYEYYWHIPPEICNEVQKGTPFYVQHMPWEMIEAVQKHQMFRFNPGVIYHMRERTLAGVETRGWGVSRMLSNFSNAWYNQVLKRYNEALALDYVVPFRTITPEAQGKEGDPILNMNMSNFTSRVLSMVRQHRQDPASWNVLPFPIKYQALGGEAKNLATPELMDQAMDEMLNAIGIPSQMYRGTLELQVMPAALRMFQQTWPQLTSSFNGWLDWASEIICTNLNWEKPDRVFLEPVTMADDLEQRQMFLQLASSNLISKRTAFAPWGIDATEEQRKVFNEQKVFDEMSQTYQKDMQSRQAKSQQLAGAQGGAPGQPAPMGGGVDPNQAQGSQTPMDVLAQADQQAQQLLQMPDSARRSELMKMKNSNETLHALVKSKLENYRSQAASQGQQAVLQGKV